uniref:NAD(P)-binding domain-containing protein n=1 Tax=Emiliania huxleyi TaxID=2903 RepID=A0A7S3WE82_EMIHU
MLGAPQETTCGGFPSTDPGHVVQPRDGRVTNVLVTGGAGFIASHFALMLVDSGGFNVTVVDDLSRGSIHTILRLQELAKAAGQPLHFAQLDVARQFEMAALLRERAVELVVHFSGNAYVGESMVRPEDYFQNITVSTVALLRAMGSAGVSKLIFSSSCATFGSPTQFPITEQTPQRPTNPYGAAKLQAEQAIIAYVKARKREGVAFSAALLRYFNVVGADPRGRIGPHLRHEANKLYPRIVDAAYDVVLGLRPELRVMGSSYPTKDGSAARDYIHVTDLVDAHVKLMAALRGNSLLYYNVGNGMPYTVLEIIKVVERVTGRPLPFTLSQERPGDPPALYSDPAKIKAEIGWEPRYADIEAMVRHGWDWRLKHYDPAHPSPSVDPLEHSGPAFTEDSDDAPKLGDNPRIAIIGAGPTGLCAAYRLTELGYTNWELVEASEKASGLACTIRDENRFSWDIGVHCLFSHFEFFDALLDEMLPPKEWLYHQRYSPARMRDTWVGYPVQANLWRLPRDEVMGIVKDLAQKEARPPPPKPRNFKEWLHAGFGEALTQSFMAPYNSKVWAHPPHEMNSIWVGERVATIRFEDILSNVIQRKDAPAWGPNAQFRYPMNGTGHIWEKVFSDLPKENTRLNARVAAVRTKKGAKALELADGTKVPFDGLLSTMPLPLLLRSLPDEPHLAPMADGDNGAADHSRFKHQTCNVFGVGIEGDQIPEALNGVHWVYFPEDEYIFYRVTVLSNFSPQMVAKPFQQWSLLIEVSESKHHPVPRSRAKLRALVKEGLVKSGMLPEGAKVVAMWDKRLEYGYPVPYVERNMHVHEADRALRSLGIWSRGRFGSWKYEVGNQDHSCFLGIDAVDSMLFGGSAAGREATFNVPNKVNVQYRKYDFDFDPAALARDAGRQHTFGKPPRRLQRLPQWDWVAHRCKEHDVWTDAVRKVMVALPRPTKWLIHSYEGCGAAEIKRPMPEMLREGLNHLDRIPFDSALPQIAAWLRHIAAHYAKLPPVVVFVPPNVPAASPLLAADGLSGALVAAKDFGAWGRHPTDMPRSMRDDFCAKLWPLVQQGRRSHRPCPERVVGMGPTATAAYYASAQTVRAVPLTVWQALLAAVSDKSTGAATATMLSYSMHIFFGEKAMLKPGLVHSHQS